MSSTPATEKLKPMTIADPETGHEYTLEFTRRSVAKAEQAGLDVNKMESSAMTMVPKLFWAAFLAHHPQMTQEQTDKILFEGLMGLSEDEMAYLGKLYAAPFTTLVSGANEENPRKMAVKF